MALSSAYEKHPQHRIEIDVERVGIRVTLHGEVLAQTTRGLNLREGNLPAVVYVPRDDVNMERLIPSDHSTHCPFKGDASYFRSQEGTQENSQQDPEPREVAWSYETPFDQMAAIRGHLAFYSDRVTIERLAD
jgi:uncharacterized protein (DUF427 family)